MYCLYPNKANLVSIHVIRLDRSVNTYIHQLVNGDLLVNPFQHVTLSFWYIVDLYFKNYSLHCTDIVSYLLQLYLLIFQAMVLNSGIPAMETSMATVKPMAVAAMRKMSAACGTERVKRVIRQISVCC